MANSKKQETGRLLVYRAPSELDLALDKMEPPTGYLLTSTLVNWYHELRKPSSDAGNLRKLVTLVAIYHAVQFMCYCRAERNQNKTTALRGEIGARVKLHAQMGM
ncbi:hypothetical protein ARMGADRAFT_1082222 [Armillaria gallica]|uniref:Uncharacterized protein n=1 Tax=Armillaria gallica TaxID=47427 RepID=A0A2H3DB13_ARMGA|nr:hypothetical protein ARMGADRAFT_1082222 [Armillaria gallica]